MQQLKFGNGSVISPHTLLDMYPDSKVHVANMGPIWGRQDPGGPHVGPMNFAIWVIIHVVVKVKPMLVKGPWKQTPLIMDFAGVEYSLSRMR